MMMTLIMMLMMMMTILDPTYFNGCAVMAEFS